MNGVRIRRPLAYLGLGCLLALLSLSLPVSPSPHGGFGTDLRVARGPGVAPGAGRTAPPPSPPAPCDRIQDSLRPDGPLPAPGAMPAGSTMAAIVARGRLIAGVDQGNYLASYRDPATGNLAGSDIDLVHQIAAALFGDPSKVQFVAMRVEDRAAALRRHQVDLVADVYTVTCARQRDVAFSTDYLQVSQRLLVPASSPAREVADLAGQPVCTSRGSAPEDVLRRLGVTVAPQPGIAECMVELQRGRVAAISSDDVLLAGMAAQDPTTRVVGRTLDTARYAVGMNPQATDLVRFVNGVLERGRADGSLAASDRRWFGNSLNPVPQPPPARYQDQPPAS